MNKKMKRNMTYQLLYQSLVFLYPLLTTPIISEAFGAETLGVYSYTYSAAYYFSLIAGLGISTYGVRITSICREEKNKLTEAFEEIYTLQFCAALAVLLAYWGACVFLFRENLIAGMLQGIMIVVIMADISWFMNGLEEFRLMVLRNVAIKLCSFVLIYFFIKTPKDLNLYILIMTCTGLAGQISMWPQAMKHVNKVRFTFKHLRRHFMPALKLLIPILAQNLYVLLDKVLLGAFHEMSQIGYYESSEKIIRMPIGLANAACIVMLPKASYDVARGERDKNNETVLNTINVMLLLGIPIAVGLGCVSSGLVPWYLGKEFNACQITLPLMAPLILFTSISTVLRTQHYIANKRDREYTTSIIISTVINLILSVLLVERWKVVGVIIGSLGSEFFGMAYLLWKARKELEYVKIRQWILLYALACIPMTVVVRAMGKSLATGAATTVAQVVAGAVVYAMGIGLGGGIKRFRKMHG